MMDDDKYMDDDLEGQKRRRGPVRRSKKGGWTQEEDEILKAAVQEFNGRSWKKIAERLPNRTNVQCLHRWQKVLNPELVKGPWTPEEDQKIIELVQEYGCENWSQIANFLDGRIGKQCRERYFNQLDPSIKKTPWTEEEKQLLMESHAKLGNKWAEISKIVVGRPNNQCKNMFHSIMAKMRKEKRMMDKKQGKISIDDADSESMYSDDLSTTYSESYDEAPQPQITTNVMKREAAQRFLRQRSHHARSYSDSAVIHFQNFLEQPRQYMYQGQALQNNPSQYYSMIQNSLQNTYGTPQAQQMQDHFRQMSINQGSPGILNHGMNHGMNQGINQNVNLGMNMNQSMNQNMNQNQDQIVNMKLHGDISSNMNMNSSVNMNLHSNFMDKVGMPDHMTITGMDENTDSALMEELIDQERPHTQEDVLSESLFQSSEPRRRSHSLHIQAPPPQQAFPQKEDFLEMTPEPYMDGDSAPLLSPKDDYELDYDMDLTSPDVILPTLDSLFDSPKRISRNHQRSLSCDPSLLGAFRFQPF